MIKQLLKKLISAERRSFLRWHHGRFGTAATLRLAPGLLAGAPTRRVRSKESNIAVFVRPGTTDQNVFNEIFITKEYALDLGDPGFIVDAGAHIGLASVFFAKRYPGATVVALEPEPGNFELLERNAQPYPNIKPLHAALWSGAKRVTIANPNAPTWSYRVQEATLAAGGGGIEAVGVVDLMRRFGVERIDVLKMDVEGAEADVLRHGHEWMDRIGNLIVELHDRFRPGCEAALEQALRGFDCERSRSGESVVIRKLRRAAPTSEPSSG